MCPQRENLRAAVGVREACFRLPNDRAKAEASFTHFNRFARQGIWPSRTQQSTKGTCALLNKQITIPGHKWVLSTCRRSKIDLEFFRLGFEIGISDLEL